MAPKTSSLFATLPDYPLAHIPGKKRELLQRGVDVIDIGAGDADIAPPPAAVAALQRAAEVPAMSRYDSDWGSCRFAKQRLGGCSSGSAPRWIRLKRSSP